MKVPNRVDVQVLGSDGKGAPGMFVRIRLRMPSKNDYDLVFGPTDAAGRITVNRDQLLAEARREAEFFLMDYTDVAEASGEISVTPLDAQALERAAAAYELYSRLVLYPATWRSDLANARETVDSLEPLHANVELR